MDIKFPGGSAISVDPMPNGISFPAIVDGKMHNIVISRDALRDHFGASDTDDDETLQQVYAANREVIHRVAESRLRQETRRVVLLSTDHFP